MDLENSERDLSAERSAYTESCYGMVHVLYGRGRGKTTSAIGQAVRAAGAGLKVDFVQFMKSGDSSEVKVLESVSGITYFCPGRHEFARQGENPSMMQLRHAQDALAYAYRSSKNGTNMLVCDEILNTHLFGLLGLEEILQLIKNKKMDLELVLTGLDCDPAIKVLADYCSRIDCIKHPYMRKEPARLGIEY